MKTKTRLKSISSLAVLLVMVLLLTMGCKKDIKDPLPPTPLPLPTPEFNDVFKNQPLKLFSDYEIANNLDFPGHVINQLGDGLAGGAFGTVVKIGKGLWKFKKWADPNDSTDFKKYMAAINQIEGQLITLQSSLDALGTQLDMDVTQMKQLTESGEMNTYITKIQSVMDSSTHNGFGYFMSEGRKFQTGIIDTNQMNIDTAYATAFANNVFNKTSDYNVTLWSEQIHALVCPPTGSSQANAFRSYANLIISQTGDAGLQNDDKALMNAYMLFESYFMQIINNQFQCMVVWANGCNYIDTTGYQANLYWEATFRNNITEEIEAYLETTEYLALNLLDYRNQSSFDSDFDYMPYGLAPDVHFRDILARSQFLSNLLYDGLGVGYPVMCGSVIVPNKYNTAMTTPDPTITFNIQGTPITPTANTIESRYPYTYWSQGENPKCAPDNIWRSYRFGKVSENGNGWAYNEYNISLVDDIPPGDSMVMYGQPWSHFATPSGKVTPLWYNPLNPSETSTTQTDSTFIQFAYFAARWNWGYSFLSNSVKYNQHEENYGPGGNDPWDCVQTPFWMKYDGTSSYAHSGFIDYGYNGLTGINDLHRVYNGTTLYAKDMQIVNAQTSGILVNTDAKVQIWGKLNFQLSVDNLPNISYFANIGTSIGGEHSCHWSSGTFINIETDTYESNMVETNSQDLELNTSYNFNTNYEINFGKEYGTLDDTYIPIQLICTNWMQVIYTGNYPLN